MPLVLRLGCYIVDGDKNHLVIRSDIPNEPIQEANIPPCAHDSPDRSSRPRSNASTMFVTSLSLKPTTQPRDAIRYVAHTVVQRRLRTSLFVPPLSVLNNMAQREIALTHELAAASRMEWSHEPGRSPHRVVHIVPQSPTTTGADFSSLNHSTTMTPSRGLFTNSTNDVGRSGGQLTHGGDDTISLLESPEAAAAAEHASPSKSSRRRFSFKERLKHPLRSPAAAASSTVHATNAVFTKDNTKSKDLCLCIADGDGIFRYCGSLQKVAPRNGADAAQEDGKHKHPTIVKMPFVAEACCQSHEVFTQRRDAARKLLGTDGSDSPSADPHGGAALRRGRVTPFGQSPRNSFAQAQNSDTAAANAAGNKTADAAAHAASREAEDERLLAPLRLSFNNSLFNSEEAGSPAAVDLRFAFLIGVVVPLTLLRALNPMETVCESKVGSKGLASDKKQKSLSAQGRGVTTKLYKRINARRRFQLFEEVKVPKELSDFTFIQESSNIPVPRHHPTSASARASHGNEEGHETKEASQELDVPVDAGDHPQKEGGVIPLAAPPHKVPDEATTSHTAAATAGTSHVPVPGSSTMPPSNATGSVVEAVRWHSPVGDPSSYICAEDGAANVQLVKEMTAEEDYVRAELAAAILAYEKMKKTFDSTAFSFGIPDASPDRGLVGQDPEVYQLMREKIELTTRLTLQQQHLDQQVSSDTRMLEMQLVHVQDEISESRARQEKLSAIAVSNSSHVY